MLKGLPESNCECPHMGSGYTHMGFFSFDYEMHVYKCQQCGYRDESGAIYSIIMEKFPEYFRQRR